MMENYAICLKNISKFYAIYKNPKDRLKEIILRKRYHTKFWALKNINLKIKKGEVLGIIGENGAGKSTLLKILSKTLTPSSGTLEIQGKVAAILELGTGFHPELTGRENIYLAGSLLGLSKQQIKEYFQAIVNFAELDSFIDQPVKTYSSGMYVRLAFSVATCVDPDILIVDEALSVGDQRFQKKCIDKIINFCKQQKTIVFCSHSMYHIMELCENAVWIKNGKIALADKSRIVVHEYENYCSKKISYSTQNSPQQKDSYIYITEINILNDRYQKINTFHTGDTLMIEINWFSTKPISGHIGFAIQTKTGEPIFGITTKPILQETISLYKLTKQLIRIPNLPLLEGEFQAVGVLLDDTGLQVLDLKLSDSFWVTGKTGCYGYCYIEHVWE